MFHAFEKAYGNIENGDSHRYEKALKEGLCGEPDTGKESSSYNRHYVWTEENYHTADGATTKKLHYAYDVYNRNVSVTGDDFTQKNHYDAEGYRDSITEKDKVTNFVYQGGMLLHELDEDKNPARHYILGNEYISQVDGTSFGYYLNDEQGSVWYLTGSDGSIRNHYRYSAFGETITAEETVPNRLRYNGQMADGLTGLYYLRARYYNASLGRFTQEDVIYNDGLNLYAYCNSNPVMYSDPSGFTKQCDPKVGGEKDSKSGSKAAGNIAKNLDTNNIPNMTKQEIIDAIPDNWKYTENNGFVHIKDEAGKIRIRIDPPDKVTQYPHVHVYDNDGNLLDSLGNIVDRKSPDGHIPYKN